MLNNLENYRIDAPAQVGVSGGRTSGLLTYKILEAFEFKPPAEIIFSFQNTGEECEETLEFLHRLEVDWKLPLVWLEWDDKFDVEDYRKPDGTLSPIRQRSPGKGYRVVNFKKANRKGVPFDRLLEYYAQYRWHVKNLGPILPNLLQRQCTSQLKIKIITSYMRDMNLKDYGSVVGIRYDEPRRWSKMLSPAGSKRADFVLPLYQDRVTKDDVKQFWASMPFDLGLDVESNEGNCRYCFLKTPGKTIEIMKRRIAANGGKVDEEIMRWVNREKRVQEASPGRSRGGGTLFRMDRPPYERLVQIATGTEPVPPLFQGVQMEEFTCACEGMASGEEE